MNILLCTRVHQKVSPLSLKIKNIKKLKENITKCIKNKIKIIIKYFLKIPLTKQILKALAMH